MARMRNRGKVIYDPDPKLLPKSTAQLRNEIRELWLEYEQICDYVQDNLPFPLKGKVEIARICDFISWDDAKSLAELASFILPQDSLIQITLAVNHIFHWEFSDAEDKLKQVANNIQLPSNLRARAFRNLAPTYEGLGNFDSALASSRHAIFLNPTDQVARLNYWMNSIASQNDKHIVEASNLLGTDVMNHCVLNKMRQVLPRYGESIPPGIKAMLEVNRS